MHALAGLACMVKFRVNVSVDFSGRCPCFAVGSFVPPGSASASTEHRVPSEVDLSAGYARRDCDDRGCTILFERPMYHLTPLR
jgi:hypothetical protein